MARVVDPSALVPAAADPQLEPFTSPWWLDRLGKQMDSDRQQYGRLASYYQGSQPLAMASQKFREAFGAIYSRWSDNFMRMVVQALEERLIIEAFAWNDDVGSKKAWTTWQANSLDAQSQKAHREAILKGRCPVIVGPPDLSTITGSLPLIRVQKPEELVIAYDDDPLERAVAMKRWTTPDNQLLATLYYPDRLEKFEAQETHQAATGGGTTWGAWMPRRSEGERWTIPHSLGAVPVVDLVNDPDVDNNGTSEIQSVLPLQDALNKLFVDLLVASEFGAFRQRWATGIEIPFDPETNKPVSTFQSSVDRVWSTAAADAKFGDFEQTEVTGILASIAAAVAHIASQTRTPPHYLLQDSGVLPSGESMRASETALVAKAKRRMRDYGESWEEIMRLAFMAAGDAKRGAYRASETQWRDPEYRTEAEHVDALVKLAALEVPLQQLWADAGYTPQQIEAFVAMKLQLPTTAPQPIAVAPVPGQPFPAQLTAGSQAGAPDNGMTQAQMESSGAGGMQAMPGPADRPGSGEEGSPPTS